MIEIDRTGGHISQTAWLMNVGRMTIYRWLKRWALWPHVNAARRARFEGPQVNDTTGEGSNLLELTRMSLKG